MIYISVYMTYNVHIYNAIKTVLYYIKYHMEMNGMKTD